MMTHYIPYDAPSSGRKSRALCGAYVLSCDFSLEPTCPTCSADYKAEQIREQENISAMGYEVRDGVMLPKEERS